MRTPIRKILVANRGEIAIRVFRTCRELGIATVAVYSDIDARAAFLRHADETYPLFGSTAAESYLNQQKIIEVAKKAGVDAIHPGYGFLSENEEFAELVGTEHLTFIGPPHDVIRNLGDKTSARALAQKLGIPVIQGSMTPLSSFDEARAIAGTIGYPVLLKAAGGGGGKGMRIVQGENGLSSAFLSAQSEAQASFGDNRVYIEKYLGSPRHIEVQILADNFGNTIHLGERECSIQRRHQKVIEESPSVIVDPELRAQLTDSATKLARAGGYANAGTVEFLLDEKKNFYFLEVNTRLQVEHPVTEMRTGLDLVKEQIRIAQDEPLGYTQEDVHFRGHAIECRIYAEDPMNNFFPATGTVKHLRTPAGGFVREDSGILEGDLVSSFYDPLLSKLITWGATRNEAIARMRRALDEYELFGVRNNLSFCSWLMDQQKFQEGTFNTNFIANEFSPGFRHSKMADWSEAAALAAVHSSMRESQPAGDANGIMQIRSGWLKKREETLR